MSDPIFSLPYPLDRAQHCLVEGCAYKSQVNMVVFQQVESDAVMQLA